MGLAAKLTEVVKNVEFAEAVELDPVAIDEGLLKEFASLFIPTFAHTHLPIIIARIRGF